VNPIGWWIGLWQRRNLPGDVREPVNVIETVNLVTKGGTMKLGTIFKTAQWGNIILLVAGILNQVTQTYPDLAQNKWILIVQALIGIVLPSLGGIGHKLAFSEAQTPANRTVGELAQAASEAKATMIAAAPSGTTVTVPTAGSAQASGTAVIAKTVIALLLLGLAAPMFAQTAAQAPPAARNGLFDLGLTYARDRDNALTPSFSADALAPFYGRLYIGPEGRLSHQVGHVNVGVGGLVELQFGSRYAQPFLSADLLYFPRLGDQEATGRYQAGAGGGIRFGGDRMYLRLAAGRVEALGGDRFGTWAYSGAVGFRL
jgi:hypothetical protein